jgi:hypothetical protein
VLRRDRDGDRTQVKTKFVTSRDSDVHYLLTSLATSIYIPPSLFHRTTQFGVWPTTPLSKTLSPGIIFFYFAARQAEPKIPAWRRSPQLRNFQNEQQFSQGLYDYRAHEVGYPPLYITTVASAIRDQE